MSPMTVSIILVLVAATAVVDWWAVAKDKVGIEEVAKPLVMAGLILVALTVETADTQIRALTIAALVFGLIGDVFLLPRVDNFVAGLGSFLLGHILYVAALVKVGFHPLLALFGVVLAGALLLTVGRRVLAGVAGTPLHSPVVGYNLIIGAMIVAAFGSARPLAIVGGLAFATSDAIIGLDRFVLTGPNHRVPIMVLYHLGQVGLLAGLLLTT